MRSPRTLLPLVVVLVLVLGALGPVAQAQDVVTVTWWTEDYIDIDQFNAVFADPFHAANPGIKLEISAQENLNDTIRTAFAAGEAPDILQTPGASFIAEFIGAGLIMPLTDAAAQYGWEDKLLPWAYQSGIIEGELYSIPLTYESMVLIYNKTLFEEKGWSVPTNLAEMEALANTAKAEGINPFSYGNADWKADNEHLMGIYLNNYAGPENVYKALIGEKKWTDPEFVEATQLLKTHIADNGWFSGSLETYFAYTWDDFWSDLANSKAAMMMVGTWGFRGATDFFTDAGTEWDWAPLPVFSDMAGEYNYELATGSTLSVNGQSDHPEAVLAVLDFLLSDPARVLQIAAPYSFGEFVVPLKFTEADFPEGTDPRIIRFFTDFAKVTGEGRYGYTTWTFWPADADVQLWTAIENVWFGEMSVEDYLSEQQALWDQARAEGKTLPIPARQ
jgi:raffinose/stachyose/melibiose transport system substrate-binding protein